MNDINKGTVGRLKYTFASLTLSSVLTLSGCAENSSADTIKMVVAKADFIVKIPGSGELEAAKATNISMPGGVFEAQVIEWLAEENTLVKKGQVVARFDPKKYRHQSEQEQFQIDKANIGYQTKENQLGNEKREISNDAQLIKDELNIANRYSVDDLRVYSRNEIIDQMKNQAYLEAKQGYTEWRGESHDDKSQSELELLRLKQGQHSAKLGMYQDALTKLEITAPHDGLFVLEKNWRGEKPRVGDTTWPGRKLGSLPDLSKLQARIFILESEAAGLKVGQRVELKLDAYPDQLIEGKLAQIDSIAKSRNNKNPVKYFEAVVSIDGEKLEHWRPGSQLKAIVFAAEKRQVISIPSQSISVKNGQYFVYVEESGDWVKREIQIGSRNTAKTEITQGLESGDIVALFTPQSVVQQNTGGNHGVL
ncbi:efflux RND transporter periplasmic adaptor subunit [Aliikangiella coralliicola]|uniref:HlyD family efflux transporter periplasmic adaptor subunit n=1 Tax=Aliikangiella coralliicola TaxID=2592383 RepID=A0A545UI78_9GAMM|nr:efflux RND transporter periplasmic adaptor subunit [Aliikangiella coralliicola]TQV89170.1 HlyD family efflux transporter periplasmic adaptor subunit [Aliikangiella coralliicola]